MAVEIVKKFDSTQSTTKTKLLKLTAYLSSPANISEPIRLDELLANAHPAYNKMYNQDRAIPLPLLFMTSDDGDEWSEEWVWAASVAILPNGSIQNNLTPLKAEYVTFYVIIDTSFSDFSHHLKRVEYLSLTKKIGKIDKWEVEESEEDWSVCCVKNGIAMRNIPASFCKEQTMNTHPIRPPYWERIVINGFEAGEKVTLRNITFRGKNKNGDFVIKTQERGEKIKLERLNFAAQESKSQLSNDDISSQVMNIKKELKTLVITFGDDEVSKRALEDIIDFAKKLQDIILVES